jgi:G:T/U-mismatch repair DNA glycosylase
METHPFLDINGLESQFNFTSSFIKSAGYLDGGIWFPTTQTLFMGTYPPNREYVNTDGSVRKGYLHYSSPRNKFWRHIDNLYDTALYIPTKIAKNPELRIENAIKKIEIAKEKKFGFVDIFSKVDRRMVDSASDADLIERETIFDNGIFDLILASNVTQIAFVYSLAKETFEKKLLQLYSVSPTEIRQYNTEYIPLQVTTIQINGKNLNLCYSPIHGNIIDSAKRDALRKVIELDLT